LRYQIERLVGLGRMPSEREATSEVVARYEAAIEALPGRATDDEAIALLKLFPGDHSSLYGLAWTVLHFVETAPGWPIAGALDNRSWWVQVLRERATKCND